MPARGRRAEVMVEGKHTVNFGAREIEGGRDHGNGRLRHIAERFLKGVEDDQCCALDLRMLGDNLGSSRFIPWFISGYHCSPQSEAYALFMRLRFGGDINKALPWSDCVNRLIGKQDRVI